MPLTADTDEHARLLALLTEHTGMELVGTRRDTALAAIEGAMTDAGIRSIDEYYARVAAGDHDLELLVDAVSIGETYFFREPAQFDFVREEIIAEIKSSRGPDTPIQMWSAGCATGEEAYSLAILLEETEITPVSKVLGTDISRAAVEGARSACYRPWSLRTLDRDVSDRYFEFDGTYYRLHERIRNRATFEQRNLVGPKHETAALHDAFDVVFLRNVLIYFDRPTVELIVGRVTRALRHGGWLITASCDPPVQGIGELQSISKRGCVFYRRAKAHAAFVDFPGLQQPLHDSIRHLPSASPEPISANRAQAPTPDLMLSPDGSLPDASAAPDAALEAFENGDYETVLQLTRGRRGDVAACSLSVRAVANLSGSLAAYRDAERACRDHPFSAELHYLRGLFLSDLGRDDDAADAFRRVTYLEPQHALAHYALGRALAKAGHAQRARRAFQTAHELCDEMDPAATLPLTEDEPAARLASAARLEIELLGASEGDKS
jgi:chemotaxis protein methyltransferase CheR